VERAIELFACIQFLIVGLSHLLQPRVWVAFFIALRGKGLPGVFANGFLSLIFGSMIVAFHNVWTGLPMVLTVVGWAQVVKALVNFVAPKIALRGMQRIALDRAWEFQVAGAIALALSGLLAYLVLRG
jgi:hypothetical protein